MTERPRIVRTPGVCGGQPRLDGTRLQTRTIARWVRDAGPDWVTANYLQLSRTDIEAALAYERRWWRRVEVRVRDEWLAARMAWAAYRDLRRQ